MEIYDISTSPPTFIMNIGSSDFQTEDGRQHPFQAISKWSQNDWANKAGNWRPFKTIPATLDENQYITSSHYNFVTSVWPHEKREIVDTYETITSARREVPKLLIVDRLIALNKWSIIKNILNQPANAILKDRWDAASTIYADDTNAITLFNLNGINAAVVLAPEDPDNLLPII